MANVPSRVVELVETFEQHVEAYRSQQYNETQLRREFIGKSTPPTNELTGSSINSTMTSTA
jgi:hypothetical protein